MADTKAYIGADGKRNHTIVAVFLRGGADGLSMVAPTEDDAYYNARPTIGVAKGDTVKVDDMFGLHPELAPLQPIFDAGDMAIVHQAGSEDQTRSHFEAQDWMEHGGEAAGGWLGRYLREKSRGSGSPLSAVAINRTKPLCLWGASASVAVESLDALSIADTPPAFMPALTNLYKADATALGKAGKDAIEALDKIDAIQSKKYVPGNDATYPTDSFADGLMQVARLIKSGVGLEAASVDLNGWDAHFASSALMNPLMDRLAKGLAAFRQDLGQEMDHVTVVVMTEFGRRVAQNVSLGTDHGRGSVMFVMGGGVRGGRVIHKWAGLDRDKLEGPGDLPVVHNYRNVIAAVLARHGNDIALEAVFPRFELAPVALYG